MALIKGANSDRLLRDAIVLDMGDLDRQAQRILAEARAEAARIIEQGKAEAQRLIDGADERGYAQGFERGQTEGRQRGEQEGKAEALSQHAAHLQALTTAWTESLAKWEADRQAMLHDAGEDVIRFAFELAKKITHRVVQHDPTIVRDQLAEALRLLGRPTSVEVLVHPDDLALAEQALPELLAEIGRCQHAAVREDASIARGGCVVATIGGRIDATIDTQLERIAEALVPNAAEHSASPGVDPPASGPEAQP